MTQPSKDKDRLKTFEFFGVTLDRRNGQGVGDCIFCGKEGHFYAAADTGQWKCHSCGMSGNVYDFIKQLHQAAFEATPESAYKELEKWRGIPAKVFLEHELAQYAGGWLIPMYNAENKLANLFFFPVKRDKNGNIIEGGKPMGATGLKLHLIDGNQNFDDEPIYVCEGFWDTYAMQTLLKRAKASGIVVGVPGATTFKEEWIERFKGHNVVLLYDNDAAGLTGMKRAVELLVGTATTIKAVDWPSSTPDGYDINDIWKSQSKSPKKAMLLIERMLEEPAITKDEEGNRIEIPLTRQRGGKPPSFQKVLGTFKKYIRMGRHEEEVLAAMFATVFSTVLPGDPLWMFVVGPPGSGKTLLCKAFDGSPHIHYESTFTAQTLVSGFRTPTGEDPSLILKLKYRTLVLKDYTEIISMAVSPREELYGRLRGAYDCNIRVPYGNGITREYRGYHFAMIAGVTDAIHAHSRAALGERFLKMELLPENHDPEEQIRASIDRMSQSVESDSILMEITADFLDRDRDKLKPAGVPAWVKDRVVALSQLVAYLRASVDRTGGDPSYRSRPEIGTRLSNQMIRLGRSLGIVYNKSQIDKRIYAIMERVALDTARGWNVDILQSMMKVYPAPVTFKTLVDLVAISEGTLRRRLNDMLELKIIERQPMHTGNPGQPQMMYKPSHKIADLWKRAKVGK